MQYGIPTIMATPIPKITSRKQIGDNKGQTIIKKITINVFLQQLYSSNWW